MVTYTQLYVNNLVNDWSGIEVSNRMRSGSVYRYRPPTGGNGVSGVPDSGETFAYLQTFVYAKTSGARESARTTYDGGTPGGNISVVFSIGEADTWAHGAEIRLARGGRSYVYADCTVTYGTPSAGRRTVTFSRPWDFASLPVDTDTIDPILLSSGWSLTVVSVPPDPSYSVSIAPHPSNPLNDPDAPVYRQADGKFRGIVRVERHHPRSPYPPVKVEYYEGSTFHLADNVTFTDHVSTSDVVLNVSPNITTVEARVLASSRQVATASVTLAPYQPIDTMSQFPFRGWAEIERSEPEPEPEIIPIPTANEYFVAGMANPAMPSSVFVNNTVEMVGLPGMSPSTAGVLRLTSLARSLRTKGTMPRGTVHMEPAPRGHGTTGTAPNPNTGVTGNSRVSSLPDAKAAVAVAGRLGILSGLEQATDFLTDFGIVDWDSFVGAVNSTAALVNSIDAALGGDPEQGAPGEPSPHVANRLITPEDALTLDAMALARDTALLEFLLVLDRSEDEALDNALTPLVPLLSVLTKEVPNG